MITNAKLKILQNRDKHIESVLAEINKELIRLCSDKIRYGQILKNLILQAMYQVDRNCILSMN